MADDPWGTHKSLLRVAILKMDVWILIPHFEAGKVQLNHSFIYVKLLISCGNYPF